MTTVVVCEFRFVVLTTIRRPDDDDAYDRCDGGRGILGLKNRRHVGKIIHDHFGLL